MVCHPVPYEQWVRSTHAYAAKNKSFQAVLRALVDGLLEGGVFGKGEHAAVDHVEARAQARVLGAEQHARVREAVLLHVGGSGSLEVEPGVLFAQKLPKILLPKNLEIEILGQILALEFYRKVDDVTWTYVTPPINLTNGPRTGVFRIGEDRALEDSRGRTRVSRADFAVALIDEAERAQHPRQRISIAY